MKRHLLAAAFLVAFAGCAFAQFEDEHPSVPWSFTDDEGSDDDVMPDPDVVNDEPVMEEESNKWEKPWFCHDHDCPKFELKKKTDEFEIRLYEHSRWVTNAVKHHEDLPKAYMRLFKYIRGKNKEKKKLEMTVPVLVTMSHCSKMEEPMDEIDELMSGGKCCHMFNVSFYVPNKFQGDRKPPVPIAEKLMVKRSPQATIAVRPFPGWATKKVIIKELKTLKSILEKEKIAYDLRAGVGFAAYDPPHRSEGRHNEVWIHLKEGQDEAVNYVF